MSKPQFAILRFAKYKGPEISNIEGRIMSAQKRIRQQSGY